MEQLDNKVADINLHTWGRKEIRLAEVEMPGNNIYILTKLNRSYGFKS